MHYWQHIGLKKRRVECHGMPLCDSNELGGYSAQVETKALELEDVKAGIGRVHVTACGHSVTMCNIISIHFTFDIVLGVERC